MRMKRLGFFVAHLLTCASAAGSVDAKWIVWGSDLQSTIGPVTAINNNSVKMVDERGLDMTVQEAVAMVRYEAVDGRGSVWPVDGRMGGGAFDAFVTLTDGQRWEALLLDESAGEDELVLAVRLVGRVVVPLDVVQSVVMAEGDRWPAIDVGPNNDGFDRIRLANGDVLRGTVFSFGSQVEIESDNGVVSVDRSTVRQMVLVNPRVPSAPVRVSLASGSIFGTRAVSGDEALHFEVVAPVGERGATVSLGAVHATAVVGVEFEPGRLIPFDKLRVIDAQPEGGRMWTADPVSLSGARLGQQVVRLPGPMTVEWTIPGIGERAAGVFALSRSESQWADCIVRLEQDGEVLFETQLNRASPSAAFSVALNASRSISVRVLPGAYGPIDDVVEIRSGWVLLADGETE